MASRWCPKLTATPQHLYRNPQHLYRNPLHPYLSLQITRVKSVIKPAPGKRKCNCRHKVVTQQVGPGMYQQYTTQVGGTLTDQQHVLHVLVALQGPAAAVHWGWAAGACGSHPASHHGTTQQPPPRSSTPSLPDMCIVNKN